VRRGEHFLNPHGLRRGLQGVERVIAIVDQVSRRLVPREGLAKLLGRPRRRRMRGDRDVPDASPIVGEEHQDEQEAAGRGRDHEEIGRYDLADVIPQERPPGLRGRLAPAPHVSRDRRLTDVEPEFQQFAMNPRRPPTRVRPAIARISVRTSAGTVGRPIRRRLFQAHHSRKPRRCQAMTVSGLTMTNAVRHPVEMRESRLQSQRSAFASRNRRGRVRCSTYSWCRNARTSSWSAARARAHVRIVRRKDRSADIIAKERIHRRPQHQLSQQERTLQQAQLANAYTLPIDRRCCKVTTLS